MKRAATISSRALDKLLVPRIEEIVDGELKIKHSDIAAEIEKKIVGGKVCSLQLQFFRFN